MLGHRGRTALPLPDVGTIVELRSEAAAGRDDLPSPLRTRVEAIEARSVEVVAPTHHDGTVVEVVPGTPVVVQWTTDLGAFLARGAVAGSGGERIGTWIVDVEQVARLQRRDAYRLPLLRPAVLQVADARVDGETRDISENGVRVVLHEPPTLEVGLEVEIMLDLDDGTALFALAEVRRLGPYRSADASPGDLEVALALHDPGVATRDVLRRFVLEEQLRRRARGNT